MKTIESCGATHPNVIGRCGRDAGHDGMHRSTGKTFQASWPADEPEMPRRLCEPSPRSIDNSPRGLLDLCTGESGCASPVHTTGCPEA